jgi:hypothetical protein
MSNESRGITVHLDRGPVVRWDKVAETVEKLVEVFYGLTMSEAALAFSQFTISQTIRAFEEGVHR